VRKKRRQKEEEETTGQKYNDLLHRAAINIMSASAMQGGHKQWNLSNHITYISHTLQEFMKTVPTSPF